MRGIHRQLGCIIGTFVRAVPRGGPTGRETLLKLLGLLRVLQDQGVEEPLAADLELDLLALVVLLDPGGYKIGGLENTSIGTISWLVRRLVSKRTGSIRPPADLDELCKNRQYATMDGQRAKKCGGLNSHLLDVSDFLRHFGWWCRGS